MKIRYVKLFCCGISNQITNPKTFFVLDESNPEMLQQDLIGRKRAMFQPLFRLWKLDPGTPGIRRKCGTIGGTVGICVNFLIFIMELSAGFATGSIAITADAFHNLTDVATSVITIVSFGFASKPADKKHPFGHGRVEYLSALLVALVVMVIGFEFIRTSVQKVLHPSAVSFELSMLVLILISIPLKILLSLFNRSLGKLIGSGMLRAVSVDALSDVFILLVASLSLILAPFTRLPLDGWLGIVVAVFIMYSGVSIARKSIDPLIGEQPDPRIVQEIKEGVLRYPNIIGVHDLVIHNYGPGRLMASVHAEVPAEVPVMELHETIDEAEKYINEQFGVFIVIHMDPINSRDEHVRAAREDLERALEKIPEVQSFHDFRIVGEGERKNLIFDVVVDSDRVVTAADESRLNARIIRALHEEHPLYQAVVEIDRSYL